MKENESFKLLRVYLMKFVVDYFNRVNVSYFIYGGIVLVVYCEGGKIIKYDGDIDVVIFEIDFLNVVCNIDKFLVLKDGDVLMLDECFFCKWGWFDGRGKEILFCGVGGKCIIFIVIRKFFR